MKKLLLLLALGLGMCNFVQPAAAPKEDMPDTKPLLQLSQCQSPLLELPRVIWEKIIGQYLEAYHLPAKPIGGCDIPVTVENKKIPPYTETERQFKPISPDGEKKIICHHNWMSVVDVKNNQILQKLRAGHEKKIERIEWLPNGRDLISKAKDGKILKWNTTTGEYVEIYTKKRGFELSSNGKCLVAFATNEHPLYIYDLNKNKEIDRLYAPRQENRYYTAKWHPDSCHIIITAVDDEGKYREYRYNIVNKDIVRLCKGYNTMGKAQRNDGYLAILVSNNKILIHNPITDEQIATIDGLWEGELKTMYFDRNILKVCAPDTVVHPEGKRLKKATIYNYDFKSSGWSTAQKAALQILEEHYTSGQTIFLEDVCRKNPLAKQLQLANEFEKTFGAHSNFVAKKYNIERDLPELEDSESLFKEELKLQEAAFEREKTEQNKLINRLAPLVKRVKLSEVENQKKLEAENKKRKLMFMGAGAAALAGTIAWLKWKS